MNTNQQNFKAKYFFRLIRGNWYPYVPDILIIDDDHLEYRKRNWHFFSYDSTSFHFQNIIGIDIDTGIFGADIIIKTANRETIKAIGFSKKDARIINSICQNNISNNTHRGTINLMADAISQSNKTSTNSNSSVADEIIKLKQLFNDGVITESEFERQKEKLLR